MMNYNLTGLVPGRSYVIPENPLSLAGNRGLGSIFTGTGFQSSDAIAIAAVAAFFVLFAPSPSTAAGHVKKVASDNSRGITALLLAAGLYFGVPLVLSSLGKPSRNRFNDDTRQRPRSAGAAISLLDPNTGGVSSGTDVWAAANTTEVPLTFFGSQQQPTFFGGQPLIVDQAPPNTPVENFNYWLTQNWQLAAVIALVGMTLVFPGRR